MKKLYSFGIVCAAGLAASSAQALTFNFNWTGSTTAGSPTAIAFQQAAAKWSALFTDNVTVNLNLGTASLGSGILAQAGSAEVGGSYSSFKSALAADASSALDTQAVSNLQGGSTFSVVSNFWGSVGSTATQFNGLDKVRMNLANARALGLWAASDSNVDADITFSTNFAFDLDPSNGITSGQFDFVGIAAHEIGHALGFVSGVDIVDFKATNNAVAATTDFWVKPLDMFRFRSGFNVPYLAANNTAKYFSTDLGATGTTRLFSNGANRGDGNQASHFKDGLGIGIMDPTAAPGELLAINPNDIAAFDAIGWNVNAVPEPATMAVLGLGALALARRKKKTA